MTFSLNPFFRRVATSHVGRFSRSLPSCSNVRRRRKSRSLAVENLEERVVLSASFFSDTFDSDVFNAANWSRVENATIDSVAFSEPTAPFAARINGNTGSGDILESSVIDLSGQKSATLQFRFERGGAGNPTEAGNNLLIQFRDASGNWIELDRKLGSGATMFQFGHAAVKLPAEALHSQFQFRFLTEGQSGANDLDDWFVDDVAVNGGDEADGEQFTDSLTQTGNLFFPNLLTFDFTDVPTPTGDATLTISADGDLSSFLENLELRAEGQLIDTLFISGGVDGPTSTVTITISRSLLESLAADGTIRFTLRPSASVHDTGSTSVTLDLSFQVAPAVNTDTDPPVIESVRLNADGKTIEVQLNNDDLDSQSAVDVNNYQLIRANGDANGDGNPFNDGDETLVALSSVEYDAENDRIVATAISQLFGDHYRITLDGDDGTSDGSDGLTDLAGNHLDGGDFTAEFDRTAGTILGELKSNLDSLDIAWRWQKYLSRPLDAASHLLDYNVGNTRVVIALLKVHVWRLDKGLKLGVISEADHLQLSNQADQFISGLQENPVKHHHRHRHCWKWSFWHRRRC